MSNYLPLMVREILSQTDWSENEIAAYSALLERGAMGLTDLASETGIPVSTLQHALKKLLLNKMLTKSIVNNRPVYSASNIEQLKKWTKGISKKYEQFKDIIDKFVDQYDFNPKVYTPKVRFYEGVKGVKQSYRQILTECDEGEIWSFFAAEEGIEKRLQEFLMTEYITLRVKKGIKSKNIAAKGTTGYKYEESDESFLSETKLVPEGVFPMNNTEINLYKRFIHCMSFDDQSAFAIIIEDEKMADILRGVFSITWKALDKGDRKELFMTDNIGGFENTINSRKEYFDKGLSERWKNSKPLLKKEKNGESVLKIEGHEVMSSFELPYMEKLAEIVTRNGGDVLNVGYGMGLVDGAIEKYRSSRKLQDHYVIEMNEHIANQARQKDKLQVLEGSWQEVIDGFRGVQFDGIIYDGYPLNLKEVHRDGIEFIEKVVQRNLLKKDGILTFYVDSCDELGKDFIRFLEKLGFGRIEFEKVDIRLPDKGSQYWEHDHFLAPILSYSK